MAKEKVHFSKTKGPITIEVDSGFSCLGAFLLTYRKKEIGHSYIDFGSPPMRIDDEIPDIHLIPLDPVDLELHRVFIPGKYMPAFGKSQISVTYSFIQNKVCIHKTEIRSKVPAGETYIRTEHIYDFVDASGK